MPVTVTQTGKPERNTGKLSGPEADERYHEGSQRRVQGSGATSRFEQTGPAEVVSKARPARNVRLVVVCRS
jgi:hypothetical protein